MRLTKTYLLFFIIAVEGYVVLASELLAIRQLIPFVGSGTETVAIIISAVLMPLAIGYHAGGRAWRKAFAKGPRRDGLRHSVRSVLLKNIISSLVALGIGLSYPFMEFFFLTLDVIGLHHRLLQTAIYAGLFIVLPVFLLGQTVPLISHYFSRARLSEITGRMLFFSTMGSFLGSVFSTLVLMSWLGVHVTVIVTMALLFALVPLLTRRLIAYETCLGVAIMATVIWLNSPHTLRSLDIVSDNAYNTAAIYQIPGEEESRVLFLNRSASSKISTDPDKFFDYWKFLDHYFIQPIAKEGGRDILIIGGGGFTVGMDDTKNRYVYIDIDKALKEVAEKHFLKQPLGPNKEFVPMSARAFVRSDTRQYDFILIDAFTNVISIPPETVTREFLADTKKRLKPGGILAVNVIASPSFEDKFTVRYDNTFASVFPTYTRQVLGEFNPWNAGKDQYVPGMPKLNNVMYVYYDRPDSNDHTIYTDDKNTYSLDR